MYVCSMSLWFVGMYVHDVTGDVERKKERHLTDLRQWKNENESCLRWDLISVLQTDALPTRQPS